MKTGKDQSADYDVLIVGGGLAGAALAVALSQLPLKIALIEARGEPKMGATDHSRRSAHGEHWDPRIYAISPTNVNFLTQIDTWPQLDQARISPVRAMHVFGDAGGRIDFSAYDTGADELAMIVESTLISDELWTRLQRQPNLQLYLGRRPTMLRLPDLPDDEADELRPLEPVCLELDEDQIVSARLLIGADGRESWIRRQARLSAQVQAYGDHGVVANFACERTHLNIARQWFRDDGVLAYLPLPGKRISIVWSTPEAHAHALLALPSKAFSEQVAAAGENCLGALELLGTAQAFPLKLIRVPHIVAPRLALVGDAAHGIHPLSGHGINLGFQDAQTMFDVLADAVARGADPGEQRLLRRYARVRREETLLIQSGTDLLYRVFHNRLPGLALLRNQGMRLANAVPLLKSALALYAAGGL